MIIGLTIIVLCAIILVLEIIRGEEETPCNTVNIPEPKTLYTGNDSLTKGGPLNGIPVKPTSESGKRLYSRGYTFKQGVWIPPNKE